MFYSNILLKVRSFGIYFIFDAINKILPFLILPIIAKYISTSDFGIVTNYLVIYQISYIFISYSTYTRLTIDYYRENVSLHHLYSGLTSLMTFIGLSVLLLVILLNKIIEYYFCISLFWQVLAVLAAYFSALGNLFTTLLVLKKKSIFYGIVQNVQNIILFGACIVLVVIFPLNWKGRIIAQLLSCTFIAFAFLMHAKKEELLKRSFIVRVSFVEYFKWGLPLLPHSLSYWFKTGFDKIVVTNTLGLSINGIYSLSLTLGSVMSLLTTSFFNVYSPYLYQQLALFDKEQLVNEKTRIINKLWLNSIVFIVGYALLTIISFAVMKFLIGAFFENDYLFAIKYLPYVLLINFLNSIYTINSGFLFYRKKNNLIGTITFSSAIVQIVLNLLLVVPYGIYGVLLSGVISALLMSSFITAFSYKEYKFTFSSSK